MTLKPQNPDEGDRLKRVQPPPERIEDRLVRLVIAPVLGLGIPLVSGLYGPLGPASRMYWLGTAWFILISFAIWQGNRWFRLQLRGQPDFINYPLRRMVRLLIFAVVYTIPVFLAMVLAWYRMAGMPADWHAIRTATVVTVVCTIFIVHDYETMYLIRQRAFDQASMAQLARSKALAELAALKAQIDPHFLFNCLNTLAGLIEEDSNRAHSFTICIADVYRYIVQAKNKNLVPLPEEMAFLESYYSLMQFRFESAIELRLSERLRSALELRIAPASLQLLLENAVKHNEFSTQSPLVVHMDLDPEGVVVWNEKRPRRNPAESSGMGLQNLDERCRLLFGRPIEVLEHGSRFTVRMPVSGLPIASGVRAGVVGIEEP